MTPRTALTRNLNLWVGKVWIKILTKGLNCWSRRINDQIQKTKIFYWAFKNKKGLIFLPKVDHHSIEIKTLEIMAQALFLTPKTFIWEFLKTLATAINHHCQKDKGFRKAKILNRAVNACQGDYVLFLDGDCLPHKDFVRDHMAMAEKDTLSREGDALFARIRSMRCLKEEPLFLDWCLREKLAVCSKASACPSP